jgi:hypothetical protein
MKKLIKMLIAAVALLGFNISARAQELMPEVTIKSVNYKYIRSVLDTTGAQAVKTLQKMAATYDIKNSEYYDDEYESYSVSMYIPQGQILAVYDANGKLLRTAEKFKNVSLPPAVRNAVYTSFPDWVIARDVYLVNYTEEGMNNKMYKLLLQNGDQRKRVKTDEKGNFK